MISYTKIYSKFYFLYFLKEMTFLGNIIELESVFQEYNLYIYRDDIYKAREGYSRSGPTFLLVLGALIYRSYIYVVLEGKSKKERHLFDKTNGPL